MIKNLSQLKKYFQNNGAIKTTFNRFCLNSQNLNIVRRPIKVQSNAVQFEGGSWLYLEKASNFDFFDGGFNCYSYTDLNPNTNHHDGITHKIKVLTYEFIN